MESHTPRAVTLSAPIVVPPSQEWDGNDGSWSTFFVNVGTPGQDFRVLVSTAASSTYIPLIGVCPGDRGEPSDCYDSRGILPFNSQQNTGFHTDDSSTWDPYGMYNAALEQDLGLDFNVSYGFDTVRLGQAQDSSALAMPGQSVGTYVDDLYWVGFLGLSPRPESFSSTTKPLPSLFTDLNSSIIPSQTFGYGAGASYQGKSVPGNLVLGGYDESRFDDAGVSFSFAQDSDRLLTLGVQSISSDDSLLGAVSMTTSGHLSAIDSTVSQLWLPDDVCDKFVEAFGLEYDSDTDLFLINDTMHSQLQSMEPHFTFRLGNSELSTEKYVNIELPYAAFDLQASYPIYSKPTNYFPIRRAKNEDQYTLGRAFLQEAYIIVDYDNGNFTVNQALWSDPMPDEKIVAVSPSSVSTDTTDSSGSGSNSSSSDSSSSIGLGAIIGIVIGAVAVLILGGAWFFLRRRRQRKRRAELASPEPGSSEAKGPQAPQEIGSSDMTEFSPSGFYAHKAPETALQSLGELSADTSQPSEMPSPMPVHELPGEYVPLKFASVPSLPNTPTRTSQNGHLSPNEIQSIRTLGSRPSSHVAISRNASWSEQTPEHLSLGSQH